jgi:hypothetical protein
MWNIAGQPRANTEAQFDAGGEVAVEIQRFIQIKIV